MSRLPLPQLTAEETRRRNSIAGRCRILSFKAGATTWSWRFQPRLPGFSPVHRLVLKLGDSPVYVDLEQLPEPAKCAPQFAGTSLQDLPRDLWLTVLDAALEPLLDQAAAVLHASVELADLTNPNGVSPDSWPFCFELGPEAEPSMLRGRLTLKATDSQRLAALLESVPPQRHCSDFSLVPFPARVILGETRLTLADFAGVARGDIVLLERHAGSEQPLCDLAFSEQHRFRARLQEGRLTLDQMATETPPAAPPAGASLDTLPVHLVFEAGQKQVTLAELQQLQPGFTFELDQPADRPLTIRANGQPVGIGEMVQIGDRVGVRVLEWVSAPTAAK